jgi:predicted nucleotidyltransferase
VETDYERIIRLLVVGGVQFVIVGGAAATAHGSSRLTTDLDIVYARSTNNIKHLVQALQPLQPKLRGVADDVPFQWEEQTIKKGLNFTLITSAGALDLFGEIIGGGTFEQLAPDSIQVRVFGNQCLCLGLERLIEVKQAAGRPKDREAIEELKVILQERRR